MSHRGIDTKENRLPMKTLLRSLVLLIGALALVALALLHWVDTALLDSENFGDQVGRALDSQRSRDHLSDVLGQQAGAATRNALQSSSAGQALQTAAPGISDGVQGLAERAASALLKSGVARDVRDASVERLHSELVAILRDEASPLSLEGQALVLDLRESLRRPFLAAGINPPAMLSTLQGLGTVVLLKDTGGLDSLAWFVRNLETMEAIAAATFGGCLFLLALSAVPRWSAVTGAAAMLTLAGILTLALDLGLRLYLAHQAGDRIIAGAIAANLTAGLLREALLLLAAGLLLLVTALAAPRLMAGVRPRSRPFSQPTSTAP
jgi:hypothetical protein